MRVVVAATLGMAFWGGLGYGQATFEVTGTPVPPDLLKANFGSLPKSIGAFDTNICNLTELKQTVISSRIYQGLASSNRDLQPLGRQLVLAAMLKRQAHRPINIFAWSLGTVTGVFSVVSASKYALPGNWATAVAFASLTSQQLLGSLKPPTTVDEIEKFESQALEPSFMLDGGSCVQRTVFVVVSNRAKATNLSFHVR